MFLFLLCFCATARPVGGKCCLVCCLVVCGCVLSCADWIPFSQSGPNFRNSGSKRCIPNTHADALAASLEVHTVQKPCVIHFDLPLLIGVETPNSVCRFAVSTDWITGRTVFSNANVAVFSAPPNRGRTAGGSAKQKEAWSAPRGKLKFEKTKTYDHISKC